MPLPIDEQNQWGRHIISSIARDGVVLMAPVINRNAKLYIRLKIKFLVGCEAINQETTVPYAITRFVIPVYIHIVLLHSFEVLLIRDVFFSVFALSEYHKLIQRALQLTV